MDNIIILQHNVLHWESRKFNLSNTYRQINPHIILINSHGMKNNEQIKIQGYMAYKRNTSNENSDAIVILIKENIKHRLDDHYITDVLKIIIETNWRNRDSYVLPAADHTCRTLICTD